MEKQLARRWSLHHIVTRSTWPFIKSVYWPILSPPPPPPPKKKSCTICFECFIQLFVGTSYTMCHQDSCWDGFVRLLKQTMHASKTHTSIFSQLNRITVWPVVVEPDFCLKMSKDCSSDCWWSVFYQNAVLQVSFITRAHMQAEQIASLMAFII